MLGKRFGSDVGGVILEEEFRTGASFHETGVLKRRLVEGALQGMRALVELLGTESVFLISKKRSEPQAVTKGLFAFRFFEETGIPETNLHFCEERSQKAGIGARLGLTFFADNRAEILQPMLGVIPHLFLFCPSEEEAAAYPEVVSRVVRVQDWPSLLRAVRASLSL